MHWPSSASRTKPSTPRVRPFEKANGALQRGVRPSSAGTWLLSIAHAVCRQRCGYDESVADELARWDAALELAACLDPERAISRDLDGLLTRGERQALHDHLRSCPECRAVVLTQRAQQTRDPRSAGRAGAAVTQRTSPPCTASSELRTPPPDRGRSPVRSRSLPGSVRSNERSASWES